MSETGRALDHLLLGIEELMRAGAEAAAALRARTSGDGDAGSSEDRPFGEELRKALAREVARWELRGDDDPAAQRVRDLFQAILEVIEPAAPREENTRTRAERTRAPRRGIPR
jgi:hypothetical protein